MSIKTTFFSIFERIFAKHKWLTGSILMSWERGPGRGEGTVFILSTKQRNFCGTCAGDER